MTHPHAEATYRTVPLKAGNFGVEITIPGTYPTTMSSFGTEAKAWEWVAEHKSFVELNASSGSPWRRRTSPQAGAKNLRRDSVTRGPANSAGAGQPGPHWHCSNAPAPKQN
jgi:hypothetical protein